MSGGRCQLQQAAWTAAWVGAASGQPVTILFVGARTSCASAHSGRLRAAPTEGPEHSRKAAEPSRPQAQGPGRHGASVRGTAATREWAFGPLLTEPFLLPPLPAPQRAVLRWRLLRDLFF